MELLKSFGIDWKILIGQIINFLILLYLLKRFALKPFLAILNERREKIEKGLRLAKEGEETMRWAKEERERILKEGEMEGKRILRDFEERARKKKEEILKEAEKEKMRILEEAKREGEREIEKMKKDFFQKNWEFVIALTEKILREKIDLKRDEKMIEDFFKNDKKIG